jgi:gluconolactonase
LFKILLKRLNGECIKIFFIFIIVFIGSSLTAQTQPEVIATGIQQPEGPVWIDTLGLLFSDIKGNKIYLWTSASGEAVPYISPSDSSNGLTLDNQGRLIICQMEKRRVARREFDGTITPLASTFRNKKFNSPNDVVVKSDGSIFFTDPDFNVPLGQKVELPFKGIYRISTSGNVQLLDSTFDKPNGICFSPDEKKLYVNESPKGEIYAWDVLNDSTIANKMLLYKIPAGGYADGMKVDPNGNIYCTGPTGVWVVSSNGEYIDRIPISGSPSNCTWGDEDRKTLYITGGNSVYKVRPEITGVGDSKKKAETLNKYILYNNYPNPFNPITKIKFNIPNLAGTHRGVGTRQGVFVQLKVYDILGNEVAILVNEEKSAGEYKIEFNGSNLPSGIYFCQLKANEFVQTKKVVLVK